MPTISDFKKEENTAVVLANQLGLITYVNPYFEKIFGWSKEEIIGKSIATIVPTRFQDAHNLGLSRFITTGQPTLLNKPLSLFAMKKNGEEFSAMHLIIAEKNNDGEWEFGATITPQHKEDS